MENQDKVFVKLEEQDEKTEINHNRPYFTFYSPKYDIKDLMPLVIEKQHSPATSSKPIDGLEINLVIGNDNYRIDNEEFFKYNPTEVLEKIKDKILQENCDA